MAATPASQWKNKIQVQGMDLPLPSGNTALVRQISPEAFITSGLIPDPLSKIITEAINSKKGLPPKKMQEMVSDPKQLSSAFELFDRVLCYVVIEPKVEMPPPCKQCGKYANADEHRGPDSHAYIEGERNPDVLYADMVDMEDKMFVFQGCLGGTKDLERFRRELTANLAGLSDGQDVQVPAKRSGGRK